MKTGVTRALLSMGVAMCLGTAFVGACVPLKVEAAALQAPLSMSAQVGFAGYYTRDQWVPVDVAVENSGGTTHATLTIDVNQTLMNGRMAQGALKWPVVIPGHRWSHFAVWVPGTVIDGLSTVDCDVDGQPVASAFLGGNAVGNVALVAVLSSKAQTAQFLTGVTAGISGPPVLLASITNPLLPANANLLNSLTALVVTPETLTSLTPSQQQSVQRWVSLGGLLVVTGTDGMANLITPTSSTAKSTANRAAVTADLGIWDPLLPLIWGPEKRVSGKKLALYVGGGTPALSVVQTYASGVKPNATLWAGNSNAPLIASMKYGRGMIVQTGFYPNAPQLLGWAGNAELWTSILGQGQTESSAIPNLFGAAGAATLAGGSDALSPLRVPSLTFWSSVFVLYVLLVGPILFWILKRVRGEAYAWVILPVLSIITTLGIYGFGAEHRPTGLLTEGLGVLDLIGDGSAEAYGIRGFMSPNVASNMVVVPGGMLAIPLAEPNVRQLGQASVSYGLHTVSSYQRVGRFGIRYLYGVGEVSRQGALVAELRGSAFGTLFGSVRNTTPYMLSNLALMWNGQMYTLGDLAPGAVAEISGTTPSDQVGVNALSTYGQYNHDVLRGFGRTLGGFAAQSLFTTTVGPDEAVLVATTRSVTPALPNLVGDQRVASNQSLVLVRQFVPVTTGME